jgi:endonuclease/exonuclease/phosphatase family metal-dependent hydrolase
MGWVMATARHLRGHQFGNAVLSRFPITHHVDYDISWKTCEPRRLQRVDIAVHSGALHVYNVHLGTAILERRHQAQRLATIVSDRHVGGPKLVLGDFNEWMRGLATTLLSQRLNSIDLRNYLRRRRTYPGLFPILHLDHIYYEGRLDVVGIELPRTRLSLVASDHLPLIAEIRVGKDAHGAAD